MKTVASGPDVNTALLLAGATLEARRKQTRPDYKIELPNFEIMDLVLGHAAGWPETLAFTASERAEPGRQLLVFRADGEQDLMPTGAWWKPATCTLAPARGMLGRVASGLLETYEMARAYEVPLREALKTAVGQLRPNRTLCIAGHGVGGALATLAALDILLNQPLRTQRVELYTFGALPAGDAGFATAMEAALDGHGAAYRVANTADGATALDGEHAGYVHTGTAWTFASDAGSPGVNHSLERGYMPGISAMKG